MESILGESWRPLPLYPCPCSLCQAQRIPKVYLQGWSGESWATTQRWGMEGLQVKDRQYDPLRRATNCVAAPCQKEIN